mmetsp:Transcript_3376/g.8030  ORF Transcript_3376/g.8030 Transcript_3376/m.8030 type:complete len:210 (+) Transcript_3376:109-738(+)
MIFTLPSGGDSLLAIARSKKSTPPGPPRPILRASTVVSSLASDPSPEVFFTSPNPGIEDIKEARVTGSNLVSRSRTKGSSLKTGSVPTICISPIDKINWVVKKNPSCRKLSSISCWIAFKPRLVENGDSSSKVNFTPHLTLGLVPKGHRKESPSKLKPSPISRIGPGIELTSESLSLNPTDSLSISKMYPIVGSSKSRLPFLRIENVAP